MNRERPAHGGKVYLVGAGPGDPGLITVQGMRCLQRADVVLYDYLVNPRLLQFCPPQAERICLGKHARSRLWSQSAIEAAMVEYALQGRQVVRLKGGDPIVFGRLGEELQALRNAQIPFEVVPGITTALAVGSLCEVPLTQRADASALAIVTGQEDQSKSEALNYRQLAEFPGTLAIYMGVTTAGHWASGLLQAGKPADTPCLLIRRVSWPNQTAIRCQLAEVAEHLTPRQKFPPPVLVLIGPVVDQAPAISWFMARPLFGQRILVTRPLHQADVLADQLEDLGADVLTQPAIEVVPPPHWDAVDAILGQLQPYDWVIWSSRNGVEMFFRRLWELGGDARRLGHARIAAIGPATAAALAEHALRADLVPDTYQSESLAAQLAPHVAGQRVLLVRASRGREVLANQLQQAGAQVEQVVAYHSRDVQTLEPDVREALEAGNIDWVTVTSSAIARSLHAMLGDQFARCRIASLSPITSATLRELGIEPTVEACTATMAGLVEAIQDHCAEGE